MMIIHAMFILEGAVKVCHTHIGDGRHVTPSEPHVVPPFCVRRKHFIIKVLLSTHSVLMRMSWFLGSSTHLQMSSWVTGIATLLDTHRSDR